MNEEIDIKKQQKLNYLAKVQGALIAGDLEVKSVRRYLEENKFDIYFHYSVTENQYYCLMTKLTSKEALQETLKIYTDLQNDVFHIKDLRDSLVSKDTYPITLSKASLPTTAFISALLLQVGKDIRVLF